jgi:hypothetical protein
MLRKLKGIADWAKKNNRQSNKDICKPKTETDGCKKVCIVLLLGTESNNFPFPDTNIQHKRLVWNKKSVNKS